MSSYVQFKRVPLGDALKIGVYSSALIAASFGYLNHIYQRKLTNQLQDDDDMEDYLIETSNQKSKQMILWTIYYPLIIQYSASVELFYGFTTITNNNSITHKSLMGVCSLCSIMVPLIHSKLYFAKPNKYETKQLLSSLFNPSFRYTLTNAYSCSVATLFISEGINLFSANKQTKPVSIEKKIYSKALMFGLGFVANKLWDKVALVSSLERYNPSLIWNNDNDNDTNNERLIAQNYYIHCVCDLDRCALPLNCVSLCFEFTVGYGIGNTKDSKTCVANVLFDWLSPVVNDSSIWRKLQDPRKMEKATPKEMYDLFTDNDDNRFVDILCEIIARFKYKHNSHENAEYVKEELSQQYVKYKMGMFYSPKLAYGLLLALTKTQKVVSYFL